MNGTYVLVVGGAGFIGSHVNEALYRQGYPTLVLDNLSQGSPEAVRHGLFIQGDMGDTLLLDQIFTQYHIEAVMHFAAFKDVGESVKDPLKYYQNNVGNTLHLLSTMRRHQVNACVFSSSAAIYGLPKEESISEGHPCDPINPYGRSKWMVENILQELSQSTPFRFSSLRYFNAAGGDPEGKIKSTKTYDPNLIPTLLNSLKQREARVAIYGNDYPTPDGTCIRDYIHVDDLASAHIIAMKQLLSGAPSSYYNLGNGQGFSVRQVIAAVEKVTGKRYANVHEQERRLGDPPILVANANKAKKELDWSPRYSLERMIEHAWNALRD